MLGNGLSEIDKRLSASGTNNDPSGRVIDNGLSGVAGGRGISLHKLTDCSLLELVAAEMGMVYCALNIRGIGEEWRRLNANNDGNVWDRE